jgi:hypothetical protein
MVTSTFFSLFFLGPTLYFVESHLVEFLIAQRAMLSLDYGFGDFSHFNSTLEAILKISASMWLAPNTCSTDSK